MRYRLTGKTLLLSAVLWLAACAPSAESESQKTADGLTVYLGVLPAAMIQGHDAGHTEAVMHDGVPRGEHAYHVVVALFDAESGKRIEDAVVEAEVAPLDLSPTRRSLETMMIADTITYGNYFTMRSDGLYRVSVRISRPGAAPVTLEFTYEHSTR